MQSVTRAHAIGGEQAGHAEGGIAAERQGVDELVVDAAVDHVDPLRAARGAHEHVAVVDEHILPLDQLDAHFLGEEGVLEIGGVELPGGEHHHRRVLDSLRRDRAQGVEQEFGIMAHRCDRVCAEQVGEQPHHRLAVLEHVRDAGRRAGVVLEHIEGLGVDAHDVDSGDVGIDPARHPHPQHLGPERVVGEHQFRRNQAGAQDFLVVVDVVEEGVEGVDALDHPGFDDRPFVGRDDPRHDVERDQALDAAFLAVDVEGDADGAEQRVRLIVALLQDLLRHRMQPRGVAVVRLADPSAAVHLIEKGGLVQGYPPLNRVSYLLQFRGQSESVELVRKTRRHP